MKAHSRRHLLTGALAATSVGILAGPAYAVSTRAPIADPLVSGLARWISLDSQLSAMEAEWGDVESVLFDKARALGIRPSRHAAQRFPEAKMLRALDRKIAVTLRTLEELAGHMREAPANSLEAAIAKVELGFRVQGPFDWRDHAFELIEDELDELRRVALT